MFISPRSGSGELQRLISIFCSIIKFCFFFEECVRIKIKNLKILDLMREHSQKLDKPNAKNHHKYKRMLKLWSWVISWTTDLKVDRWKFLTLLFQNLQSYVFSIHFIILLSLVVIGLNSSLLETGAMSLVLSFLLCFY